MTQYAEVEDLTTFLGAGYSAPGEDEAGRLLQRASEVLDDVTRGRAQLAYDGSLYQYRFTGYVDPQGINPPHTTEDYQLALKQACCAQVEYWLELGEGHDVSGLRGFMQAGRVQVSALPGTLGPRARRALNTVDLLSAQVYAR